MQKREISLFFSRLDHIGPGQDQKLSTSNGLYLLETPESPLAAIFITCSWEERGGELQYICDLWLIAGLPTRQSRPMPRDPRPLGPKILR